MVKFFLCPCFGAKRFNNKEEGFGNLMGDSNTVVVSFCCWYMIIVVGGERNIEEEEEEAIDDRCLLL